jgi:hypothetical protein
MAAPSLFVLRVDGTPVPLSSKVPTVPDAALTPGPPLGGTDGCWWNSVGRPAYADRSGWLAENSPVERGPAKGFIHRPSSPLNLDPALFIGKERVLAAGGVEISADRRDRPVGRLLLPIKQIPCLEQSMGFPNPSLLLGGKYLWL